MRIGILVLEGTLLFLNCAASDIILRLLNPIQINTLYSSFSMCLHGAESFLRSQQFSANENFHRVLWNLKVYYRTHNSPSPVLILNHINLVVTHSTSWRSTLILSSHLRQGLPSGHFPSAFPTKPATLLSLIYMLYAQLISLFLIQFI